MALFGDKKQDQDSGTGIEGELERLKALALPELGLGWQEWPVLRRHPPWKNGP
jgi:hypothetical protein